MARAEGTVQIKSWDEQAATLRDEAAQRAALSLIVGRLHDFARQVRDRIAAVDWSLQRDLIRLLVRRVEIDHGDINVVFRVAPSFDPGYGGSQDDRSLHHRGRGDYATLRRPLVSFHTRAVRSLKWSCQPALDVKLNPLASVVLSDRPHQEVMADIVKRRRWLMPLSRSRRSGV